MTGQRIGYRRVSTIDQNTARQLDGLAIDKVFEDKASGKDTVRPQLQAAMEFCREGDTLLVHSMDRLARNLTDLRMLVRQLTERGVAVQFQKEALTFTGEDSPMANLLLPMLGAAAEHANCNWAVATGEESGIVVLEMDRVLSQRVCREMMKNHPHEGNRIEGVQMDQTLTAMAGMGEAAARYSFFRWPRYRRMRRMRLSFTPGVRLHGEEDYVLIPPSTRTNGERYVYVDPEADPLAAPSWLLSLAFEPEDGDG